MVPKISIRFILVLAAFSCLVAWANATVLEVSRSDVLKAPLKISFGEWKQIRDLVGSTEYLETFPSPIVSGYSNNDEVPLRVFIPSNAEGPVPVVLIAHYWGATDLKAESALAADLNEKGLAAAVITLPYHMERTPNGAKSGVMAIQPDPVQLSHMMLQSEQDVRRAMDFLDTRKEFLHSGYGISGISLGALVAELTYAVDNRVSSATFALGGVDLAHVIWNSSRVVAQKQVLREKGLNEATLRSALEPVEPLSYLPRRDSSKSFVIEARFDSVMPKLCTEELLAKLNQPQVLRLETGHYGGVFVEGKILRTVAEFFEDSMHGQNFVVPARFSSLTLRLGGMLAYPQGVDLGAGVDLFHLDPGATRFGTLFVTPRGLRFFLAQSISSGFAVGLVASTKGLGAGLMWSIVL